jgi:hypothetical protein
MNLGKLSARLYNKKIFKNAKIVMYLRRSSSNFILLAISCFIMISFIIYSIRIVNVTGYEASIYENIPVSTWICFILSYLFGSYILIESTVLHKNDDITQFFKIGFLILFLLNFVILLIPRIKYTVLWDRWDSWYYIGYSRDILQTGHIDTFQDPYPALHILMSSISNICGIGDHGLLSQSILITPFIFSFYMIFLYIISKKILENLTQVAIAISISVGFPYMAYLSPPPLGYVTTTPFAFSSFLVLLCLILYFSQLHTPKVKYKLLLVLSIFAITIAHMLTAIFVCLVLLFLEVFKSVKEANLKIERLQIFLYKIDFKLIVLSTITIVAWLIHLTDTYVGPVRTISDVILVGEVSATPYTGILELVGLTGFDIIILFFKIFTPSLIVVIVSMIAAILLIKKTNQKSNNGSSDLFVLLGWFCLSALMFIILTTALSNIGFDPYRLAGYGFLLAPILVGYGFGMLRNNRSKKNNDKIFVCFILLILTVSFVTGLAAKYPSPYTETVNFQTTEQDIYGVKWIDSRKDPSTKIMGGNYNSAILAGLRGYDNFFQRDDFKWGMQLPIHLGYNDFAVYNEMTEQHYLLLTKFDFVMHERRGELSKDDLNRIESDKHFNAIYSNGEYNIYSSTDI